MKKTLKPSDNIIGTTHTINDFWSWGFSDIKMNSLRGVFAEFIVGSALNILEQPRIEWDAFDLLYKEKRIEVKSSAYIQSWHIEAYSKILFNIGAKKSYDYKINKYSVDSIRNADLYVFCLLKEKDAARINPLDMEQWEFYIVPTSLLNDLFPTQKILSLTSLKNIANTVSYYQIKEKIDALINTSKTV